MFASPVQRVGLLKLLLQQEVKYLWEEVRNKILECNIFQNISCLRSQQTHEIQLKLVTGPTEVYVCVCVCVWCCVCLCFCVWCDLILWQVQAVAEMLNLFNQEVIYCLCSYK
jgi:hypothetical protein